MKLKLVSFILALVFLLCSCTPASVSQTTTSLPDTVTTGPAPTTSPSTKPTVIMNLPYATHDDTYPPMPDPYIRKIYAFFTGEELLTFLNEEIATGANGLATTPEMHPIRLFLDRIAEKGLAIPCFDGEPLQMFTTEVAPKGISLILADWFYRTWVYYRCRTEAGDFVLVSISPLEEELEALAKEATVLEVLQKIHPKVYESASQKEENEVYERKVTTAFGEQIAFVLENTERNEEYIRFIQGHWLINMKAEKGIITDEWLKEFELRPLTLPEQ